MSKILMNDFKRLWADIKQDALNSFSSVGDSGFFILGKNVECFEKVLAEKLNAKYVVGVGNGLDALVLSLKAHGVKNGDIVVTTPLSAFATTLAICELGARPLFVDINESGNVDSEKVFSLLSRQKIKFFLPVHLYGHSLNRETIRKISKTYQVTIIEDAAQAIGQNQLSDLMNTEGSSCLAVSFYPTKNLGCIGDGGAIVTNSKEIMSFVQKMRNYGEVSKYEHELLGKNSRLDELHASYMLNVALPRIDSWNKRRKEIAKSYIEQIKNPLVCPVVPQDGNSSWHLFPVRIKNNKRNNFLDYLDKHGIQSLIHYPRLITEQPSLIGYGKYLIEGKLDNAKLFTKEVCSLPIHPYLKNKEIEMIIDIINKW